MNNDAQTGALTTESDARSLPSRCPTPQPCHRSAPPIPWPVAALKRAHKDCVLSPVTLKFTHLDPAARAQELKSLFSCRTHVSTHLPTSPSRFSWHGSILLQKPCRRRLPQRQKPRRRLPRPAAAISSTTGSSAFFHDRQLRLPPRPAAPPSPATSTTSSDAFFHELRQLRLQPRPAALPSSKAGGDAFLHGRWLHLPPRPAAMPSSTHSDAFRLTVATPSTAGGMQQPGSGGPRSRPGGLDLCL